MNTVTTDPYADLAGKVAVITGGSSGLGAETAATLSGHGVATVVVGRDRERTEEAAERARHAGSESIAVLADCRQEEQLHDLRERAASAFGAVDILAAFAGGDGMPVATKDETGTHWRDVIETDLTSTFLTVSTFLPGMIDRGSGAIVTMASAAARVPGRSAAAYAAAKAGVIAFSRHLALEHGPDGIRVNCISPSAVETDRMRGWVDEDTRRRLAQTFPLRRIGRPSDVANATAFLASEASGWITGTTLDVSGGKVMI